MDKVNKVYLLFVSSLFKGKHILCNARIKITNLTKQHIILHVRYVHFEIQTFTFMFLTFFHRMKS